MKELTILEQIILAGVERLKDSAYGVSIRREVVALSGRNIMYGTLYNALDQLTRKGFVRKSKGKPGSERGKHGRVFYGLTAAGLKALQSAYALQKSIWDSIPHLLKDYKP